MQVSFYFEKQKPELNEAIRCGFDLGFFSISGNQGKFDSESLQMPCKIYVYITIIDVLDSLRRLITSKKNMVEAKKVEALPPFEEAFKRDKSPQSVVRLYRARAAAGQSAEAAKLAADLVKANPKDLVLRSYLAERSLTEQKYELAAQQYRQMLELAPKNPMLLNNLAWVLGKLGDKSAISVAQQAVALAPNSPVVLDTLGGLLMDSGDTAKGVEQLKRAVSLGPNLPALRLNLAKGLVKIGDKDGARKELDAAMSKAPEKSAIRAELDKLKASL